MDGTRAVHRRAPKAGAFRPFETGDVTATQARLFIVDITVPTIAVSTPPPTSPPTASPSAPDIAPATLGSERTLVTSWPPTTPPTAPEMTFTAALIAACFSAAPTPS